MENTNSFTYSYSAVNNKEIERIRRRYLPQSEDKMETLRSLDARVQSAGMIESLSLGIIGCLIFGIGMCFGLGVFGGGEWLALVFGGIGTLVMLPAYPLYRRIREKTKARLTPEILRLSEEIMESGNFNQT